ncbi:MAG: hypothetical protein Devi2KO_01270 [Devosia indica]
MHTNAASNLSNGPLMSAKTLGSIPLTVGDIYIALWADAVADLKDAESQKLSARYFLGLMLAGPLIWVLRANDRPIYTAISACFVFAAGFLGLSYPVVIPLLVAAFYLSEWFLAPGEQSPNYLMLRNLFSGGRALREFAEDARKRLAPPSSMEGDRFPLFMQQIYGHLPKVMREVDRGLIKLSVCLDRADDPRPFETIMDMIRAMLQIDDIECRILVLHFSAGVGTLTRGPNQNELDWVVGEFLPKWSEKFRRLKSSRANPHNGVVTTA